MRLWKTSRVIVLALLHVFLSNVNCEEVFEFFELKLNLFKNDDGLNSTGHCCDGHLSNGKCSASCRTFFRICLTHYMAVITDEEKCTFANVTTPVLGYNSVDFNNDKLPEDFKNPKTFKIGFSWPGTFSLIVQAYHDVTNKGPYDDSPRKLISEFKVQRSLVTGKTWHNFTHTTERTEYRYGYRVFCTENRYGPTCSRTCTPRNDTFGHYSCDSDGHKVCLPGWTGDYCEQAICKEGCDPKHGICNEPGECNCRLGYGGANCSECLRYPGCLHGTCKKPWQCICEEGWGGLFCNQDLNFCTHHTPCKNGGICQNTGQGSYTCQCPDGYGGTECEIEIDDCQQQPCKNGGICQDYGSGFKCKCPEGYTGKRCDTMGVTCSMNPCREGSTCQDVNGVYKCICPPGYYGPTCETEINECDPDPCQNGNCVDELNGYRCVCALGFQGVNCSENINDCKDGACLNGGTCVDEVNDFKCRCVPGFVGSLCQLDLDDCQLMPCSNGGTCHDRVNDFFCECIPGFYGKDCSVYQNECLTEPCKNGGHCKDLINDFECTCKPGFFGKDCSKTFNTGNSTPRSVIANGSDRVVDPNDDDADITMTQLLLIVCLGVGIPLILLIIVAIFLLLRKRNSPSENSPPHDKEHPNIQNSINNKLESGIFTTNPTNVNPSGSSGVMKITNEENDFNTYKPGQHRVEKATNKQFLYNKELNTQEHFAKTPPLKDINRYCEKYESDNSSGSTSINDVSNCCSYNTGIQSDIHIIGNSRTFNKDTNRHSTTLPIDPHRHSSYYHSDDMLATEV